MTSKDTEHHPLAQPTAEQTTCNENGQNKKDLEEKA